MVKEERKLERKQRDGCSEKPRMDDMPSQNVLYLHEQVPNWYSTQKCSADKCSKDKVIQNYTEPIKSRSSIRQLRNKTP